MSPIFAKCNAYNNKYSHVAVLTYKSDNSHPIRANKTFIWLVGLLLTQYNIFVSVWYLSLSGNWVFTLVYSRTNLSFSSETLPLTTQNLKELQKLKERHRPYYITRSNIYTQEHGMLRHPMVLSVNLILVIFCGCCFMASEINCHVFS